MCAECEQSAGKHRAKHLPQKSPPVYVQTAQTMPKFQKKHPQSIPNHLLKKDNKKYPTFIK